jgi:thioredoxin 1
LAADALEDLVQQILWLDMDQVRREQAEQADTQQLATTGVSRRAGLAPTAPRYGWPGL